MPLIKPHGPLRETPRRLLGATRGVTDHRRQKPSLHATHPVAATARRRAMAFNKTAIHNTLHPSFPLTLFSKLCSASGCSVTSQIHVFQGHHALCRGAPCPPAALAVRWPIGAMKPSSGGYCCCSPGHESDRRRSTLHTRRVLCWLGAPENISFMGRCLAAP
jgi:hypothetical protein